MDVSALAVSIFSLLVTGGISAAALVYARRADARAVDAAAAAARAENRERAAARIAALERMLDAVREISHATADALTGDVSALGRTQRHRARLRASLDAAPVELLLPKSELVAGGAGGVGPEFANALAELQGAIAVEHRQMAE